MGKYHELEMRAQHIFTCFRQTCIFAFPNCKLNTVSPELKFTNHLVELGHCEKVKDGNYNYNISIARSGLPVERVVRNVLAHEIAHAISDDFGHGSDFAKVLCDVDHVLNTDSSTNSSIIEDDLRYIRDFDEDLYYRFLWAHHLIVDDYFDLNNPPQRFFREVYAYCKEAFSQFSDDLVCPELIFSNSFGRSFYCTQFAEGEYKHYIFIPFHTLPKTDEVKTAIVEYFACMLSNDWKYGKRFRSVANVLSERYSVSPDWGKGFHRKTLKDKTSRSIYKIVETNTVRDCIAYANERRKTMVQ